MYMQKNPAEVLDTVFVVLPVSSKASRLDARSLDMAPIIFSQTLEQYKRIYK